MVVSQNNGKRRRKDGEIIDESIPDSPKRTKVHAQRKFAQGSNLSSPALTPVKDKDKVKTNGAIISPELLPSKRPKTEDFLTFLCLRGTPILPPRFNFFNIATLPENQDEDQVIPVTESTKDGAKSKPLPAASCGKASNGATVPSRHSNKLPTKGTERRTTEVNGESGNKNDKMSSSTKRNQMGRQQETRKKRNAVQALKKKYQEQRLARQRGNVLSQLAQRVKDKNMIRTRSASLLEESKKPEDLEPVKEADPKPKQPQFKKPPVKKIVVKKNLKPNVKTVLGSKLTRMTTRSIIQTRHPKATIRQAIRNRQVKRFGLRSGGQLPPGSEIGLKSERELRQTEQVANKEEKDVKDVKKVERTRILQTKDRKQASHNRADKVKDRIFASSLSDFSSDDDQPLVKRFKPSIQNLRRKKIVKRALRSIVQQKKKAVSRMMTRSQQPADFQEVALETKYYSRPRKTKEAATVFMELIGKKLAKPDDELDDEELSEKITSDPLVTRKLERRMSTATAREKHRVQKHSDAKEESVSKKPKETTSKLDTQNKQQSKTSHKTSEESKPKVHKDKESKLKEQKHLKNAREKAIKRNKILNNYANVKRKVMKKYIPNNLQFKRTTRSMDVKLDSSFVNKLRTRRSLPMTRRELDDDDEGDGDAEEEDEDMDVSRQEKRLMRPPLPRRSLRGSRDAPVSDTESVSSSQSDLPKKQVVKSRQSPSPPPRQLRRLSTLRSSVSSLSEKFSESDEEPLGKKTGKVQSNHMVSRRESTSGSKACNDSPARPFRRDVVRKNKDSDRDQSSSPTRKQSSQSNEKQLRTEDKNPHKKNEMDARTKVNRNEEKARSVSVKQTKRSEVKKSDAKSKPSGDSAVSKKSGPEINTKVSITNETAPITRRRDSEMSRAKRDSRKDAEGIEKQPTQEKPCPKRRESIGEKKPGQEGAKKKDSETGSTTNSDADHHGPKRKDSTAGQQKKAVGDVTRREPEAVKHDDDISDKETLVQRGPKRRDSSIVEEKMIRRREDSEVLPTQEQNEPKRKNSTAQKCEDKKSIHELPQHRNSASELQPKKDALEQNRPKQKDNSMDQEQDEKPAGIDGSESDMRVISEKNTSEEKHRDCSKSIVDSSSEKDEKDSLVGKEGKNIQKRRESLRIENSDFYSEASNDDCLAIDTSTSSDEETIPLSKIEESRKQGSKTEMKEKKEDVQKTIRNPALDNKEMKVPVVALTKNTDKTLIHSLMSKPVVILRNNEQLIMRRRSERRCNSDGELYRRREVNLSMKDGKAKTADDAEESSDNEENMRLVDLKNRSLMNNNIPTKEKEDGISKKPEHVEKENSESSKTDSTESTAPGKSKIKESEERLVEKYISKLNENTCGKRSVRKGSLTNCEVNIKRIKTPRDILTKDSGITRSSSEERLRSSDSATEISSKADFGIENSRKKLGKESRASVQSATVRSVKGLQPSDPRLIEAKNKFNTCTDNTKKATDLSSQKKEKEPALFASGKKEQDITKKDFSGMVNTSSKSKATGEAAGKVSILDVKENVSTIVDRKNERNRFKNVESLFTKREIVLVKKLDEIRNKAEFLNNEMHKKSMEENKSEIASTKSLGKAKVQESQKALQSVKGMKESVSEDTKHTDVNPSSSGVPEKKSGSKEPKENIKAKDGPKKAETSEKMQELCLKPEVNELEVSKISPTKEQHTGGTKTITNGFVSDEVSRDHKLGKKENLVFDNKKLDLSNVKDSDTNSNLSISKDKEALSKIAKDKGLQGNEVTANSDSPSYLTEDDNCILENIAMQVLASIKDSEQETETEHSEDERVETPNKISSASKLSFEETILNRSKVSSDSFQSNSEISKKKETAVQENLRSNAFTDAGGKAARALTRDGVVEAYGRTLAGYRYSDSGLSKINGNTVASGQHIANSSFERAVDYSDHSVEAAKSSDAEDELQNHKEPEQTVAEDLSTKPRQVLHKTQDNHVKTSHHITRRRDVQTASTSSQHDGDVHPEIASNKVQTSVGTIMRAHETQCDLTAQDLRVPEAGKSKQIGDSATDLTSRDSDTFDVSLSPISNRRSSSDKEMSDAVSCQDDVQTDESTDQERPGKLNDENYKNSLKALPDRLNEKKPILPRRAFLHKIKDRKNRTPSANAFSPENESSVYAFESEPEMPVSTPFRSKAKDVKRRSSLTLPPESILSEPLALEKLKPPAVLKLDEESETEKTIPKISEEKPPPPPPPLMTPLPVVMPYVETNLPEVVSESGQSSPEAYVTKNVSSTSIAVQVNLDEMMDTQYTVLESEVTSNLIQRSMECSTQTDDDQTLSDSEGHLFYIPLQPAGPSPSVTAHQLIQGVAVKLGTEGPTGPNQRVIMRAKLVTKPPVFAPQCRTTTTMCAKNSSEAKQTANTRSSAQTETNKPKVPASTVTSSSTTTVSPPVPTKPISKTCATTTSNVGSSVAPTTSTKGAKAASSVTVQSPSTSSPAAGTSGGRKMPAAKGGKSAGGSKASSASSSASSSRSSTATKRPSQKHRSVRNSEPNYTCTPVRSISFPKPGTSAQMVQAPVFHPTEEEFQDPLEFFDKIRPVAEQFGLCRVVPPSNFKPECKVSDDMRFMAYNQYVHKMLHRWGPNMKEMMAIKKYLETQSISFVHPPWIGGMEVDLPRLYQTVQTLGGLKEVIEKKRWQRVADAMKIPKSAQDRVTKLDDIYCKYLLPYDTLSPGERKKLFDEVENEWTERLNKSSGEEGSEDESDNDTSDECEECIVKGRTMPLNAFYRIARNTMSMWFRSTEPSASEVEQEYWRLVVGRNHHVCVHSGSIDSSVWGYGFPVSKNSPFAKHPWNLKVFTNNSGSILRSMGPVMGVTVPTLHVGMLFTACCWYRDPHGLPWVEYLHTGASKIWYGIPDSYSSQFRKAMTKLVPRYLKSKTIWLPSDTAMVPPSLLVNHGVSLCHTVQEPGQFILVFPRAFTSSVCTGYLVSESVYFAQPSWLSTAEEVFKYIHDSCEPSMFSLERLLFSVANDSRSHVDVLRQVLSLISRIRQQELDYRKQLYNLGLKTSERLALPEASLKRRKSRAAQEEESDYECEICRANLYVSLVTNSHEEGVYCLPHAIELLTKKRHHLKYCKLIYTYDQAELNELIQKLQERIEVKSHKKNQSKHSSQK